MLNWMISVVTVIIISLMATYLFKQDWTIYQSFVATYLFAIFLKLKD